jgi:hypothetical protein
VASYHAPNGGYALDSGYFATAGFDNAPLHALKDGLSAGNAVFVYGPSSSFPTGTYNSSNYWVDVVFTQIAASTPPIISNLQATQITSSAARITWTTDKPTTSLVNYGTTSAYGSSAQDPALVTSHSISLAGLSANTQYHFNVQSTDVAANTTSSSDSAFTTQPVRTTPPVFSNVQATSITSSSATISWTTDEPASSQVNYGTSVAYGLSTPLDSTKITSHSMNLAGLSAATLYHFQVTGQDSFSNTGISSDFTFSTNAAIPSTLWSASATPSIPSQADSSSIELGVKFTSDIAGRITGVRFYKGAGNTGTHIGNLWTSSGTLLATATFTNETATGWQQVTFSTPVSILANTVYVASYYAPNGGYSVDTGYFTSAAHDAAPLHALKDGVSGGNGLYIYGAGSAFPLNTYSSSNYWVDVAFVSP